MLKFWRRVAFAALIMAVLKSTAFAQQQIPLRAAPDGGQAFPEVIFHGGAHGYMGQATFYQGHPIIIYDVDWMPKTGGFSSDWGRFMTAHEYGHHRLRHGLVILNTAPQLLQMLDFQQELEADCWATQTLARQSDRAAVRGGVNAYIKFTPPADTTKPGHIRRIANIKNCWRAATGGPL